MENLKKATVHRVQPSGREKPDRSAHRFLPWMILGVVLVISAVIAIRIFLSFPDDTKKATKKQLAGETAQKKTEETSPKKKKSTVKYKKQLEVVIHGLNLRSAPERAGRNVIRTLPKRTKLNVVKEIDSWYEVLTEDREKGYVSNNAKYVREIKQ